METRLLQAKYYGKDISVSYVFGKLIINARVDGVLECYNELSQLIYKVYLIGGQVLEVYEPLDMEAVRFIKRIKGGKDKLTSFINMKILTNSKNTN